MRSSNEVTYKSARLKAYAAYAGMESDTLRKAAARDAARLLENTYLLRSVTDASMLRARAQLAKGVW